MNAPSPDDRPLRPSDRAHLRLAERGSALFPEAASQDGRISLTDAMLAIAALACCMASLRGSILLGITSLVVVLPALTRTHVVMIRRRGQGDSPGVGAWLLAFVSSASRITLALAPCVVTYGIGLGIGHVIARQGVKSPVGHRYIIGGLACSALGAFASLLILWRVAPRLLRVREGFDA